MTREQLKILKQEFQKDPNWEGQEFTNLAQRLGVPRIKIYKWWWDVRKKHEKATKEVSIEQDRHATAGETPSPWQATQTLSEKVEDS